MTRWLVDTSVAVPLLLTSHAAHELVDGAVEDREVELAAHAALETYSVLTRLPGDARLTPDDAGLLLRERFGPVIVLSEQAWGGLVDRFAKLHIAGGAVYDALIAVTAQEVDAILLTRDHRASATYAVLGVTVEMIAGTGDRL